MFAALKYGTLIIELHSDRRFRCLQGMFVGQHYRSRVWAAYVERCGWSCDFLAFHPVQNIRRLLDAGICLPFVDSCGELNGYNQSCMDTCGVPNGNGCACASTCKPTLPAAKLVSECSSMCADRTFNRSVWLNDAAGRTRRRPNYFAYAHHLAEDSVRAPVYIRCIHEQVVKDRFVQGAPFRLDPPEPASQRSIVMTVASCAAACSIDGHQYFAVMAESHEPGGGVACRCEDVVDAFYRGAQSVPSRFFPEIAEKRCTRKGAPTGKPHQITSPDAWCSHTGAVHQNIPGCGRVCSDMSGNRGVKSQGTWGANVPCSACPAADWPGCSSTGAHAGQAEDRAGSQFAWAQYRTFGGGTDWTLANELPGGVRAVVHLSE